ncbi:hypothetical protein FRC20_009780 [Serendipita sp. 405]|nr:hypothetical protein FRC20_009780 [Serendipita sp. 405]
MRPFSEKPKVPNNHHPCSPRFLLSLLSTAFYLSITSLTTEVLRLILSTIGPLTVVRYLDYALGKGIGSPNSTFVEPERAVTLENVGEDTDSESISTENTHGANTGATEGSYSSEEDDLKQSEITTLGDKGRDAPSYLYGFVGNKIGEACATFLARWGIDLLHEEEDQRTNPSIFAPSPLFSTPLGVPNPDILTSNASSWRSTSPKSRIWSEGLSPEWVYGVLSSDELFVRDETKRYEAAKRVVEMRRRLKGIVENEETWWHKLFNEGIYYSHFSWDELSRLSEDISPTTNKPYVSLSRLQTAHWAFSSMRHLVTKRTSSSAPFSQDLKLGIARTFATTSQTKSTQTIANEPKDLVLWPVFTDGSTRVGDPGNTGELQDLLKPPTLPRGRPSPAPRNFFGIGSPKRTRDQLLNSDEQNIAENWIPYEPFRFSVEFWGIESLNEKTRLHSHTIWYAGSCYNVYTQSVRKKGPQVGIYLHRQSNVDPIPAASAPRSNSHSPRLTWSASLPSPVARPLMSPIAASEILPTSRPHARSIASSDQLASTSRGHTSGSSRSPPHRSSTPVAIQRANAYMHSNLSFSPTSNPSSFDNPPPSSPTSPGNGSHHASIAPVPPSQPYRDPRPAISAFFAITCHSATGSSFTKFSSGPDTFAVSQSWGWKSSSLDVGAFQDEPVAQELSLRASVVIGLV